MARLEEWHESARYIAIDQATAHDPKGALVIDLTLVAAIGWQPAVSDVVEPHAFLILPDGRHRMYADSDREAYELFTGLMQRWGGSRDFPNDRTVLQWEKPDA